MKISKIKIAVTLAVIFLLFVVALFLLGGVQMSRLVELTEGITVNVPANFPKAAVSKKGDSRIISFSIKPHKDSQRYIHFFEFVVSPDKADILKELPSGGYELSGIIQEDLQIGSQRAVLKTAKLDISRPCGSKEKAQVYALELFCQNKKSNIYLVTFTMTKKGFLDIVKTIKCH